jgi:hypothetical protein
MFLGPLYDFTDNAFSVENVDIFIRLLACSNSCTAASLRAHSFPLCNLSRSRLGGAMVGPKTGRPAGAAGPASRLPSPTLSSHHRPTKTSFERRVRRSIVCRVAKPSIPYHRSGPARSKLRRATSVISRRQFIREIQQQSKSADYGSEGLGFESVWLRRDENLGSTTCASTPSPGESHVRGAPRKRG